MFGSLEINVKGSFHVAQTFLRAFEPSGSHPKTLILLSSMVGHLPSSQLPGVPASYQVSKIAEAKLAESLATENPEHFRVYAMQPGIVDTSMSEKGVNMAADPEAARQSLLWDEPELPAGFMLWLASKRGECVPSGRFLWINWDVDELEERAEEMRGDDQLLTMGLMGWPFT